MPKSSIRWKLLLEYRNIFPDTPANEIEFYLSGIDKAILLRTATFFLGFKNQKSKYEDLSELFSAFFQVANKEFAAHLFKKIRAFEKNGQKEVIIINTYSSLRLFEIVYSLPIVAEIKDSAQFERDVFIAYLLINQQQTDGELLVGETTSHLAFDLKMPMITMSHLFYNFEIVNHSLEDLWITQTIKAIILFRYLEGNDRTQFVLDQFLTHFQCDSWQSYLKKYLPLSISAIKAEREAYIDIVPEGNDIHESIEFIERLILLNDTALDEIDFRTLRSNPIYKFEVGRYRIIYGLFVIEKLFKGLYFMLNHFNELLPPEERIRNFRSDYCDKFSEKTLFNGILKSIFNTNCISLSGEEILAKGIEAEPDFYVRKGKSIYLFESKDILINANIKRSRDFNVYEAELKKKLYYVEDNGNRKPKAVLQLINNIKRVLTRGFDFDQDYFYRKVEIYPVLVLHDQFFNIPGLNTLLNSWFEKEVQKLKLEGYFIGGINPLVVITVDFFIQYQDVLRNNPSILIELLDKFFKKTSKMPLIRKQYHSQSDLESIMHNISMPFGLFGYNYLNEKEVSKVPEMLKEYGYSLFEK